jgi:hypothetical protein
MRHKFDVLVIPIYVISVNYLAEQFCHPVLFSNIPKLPIMVVAFLLKESLSFDVIHNARITTLNKVK